MELLILDRDGVINHDSDAYIKTLEEWVPIPGSVEAIAQLSKAGWTVAVATNQSGIARGYYTLATLEAMHARLRELVAEQGARWAISSIARTGRTKAAIAASQKPGMLVAIAEHYRVGLQGVWFVGDSKGDLEAALAVGAQPVLVKTGKGERTLEKGVPETTLIFDDLAAIARELI